MPHDRAKRQKTIEDQYEFVVYGSEYSISHAALVALDLYITRGALTVEYLKDEVKQFGIDLVLAMTEAGISPAETLYLDKFMFHNWETPIAGIRVALPNKFVPYVAARRRIQASAPAPLPETGNIMHTLRKQDGLWTPAGDMTRQVSLSGAFISLDCAGRWDDGSLHLICIRQDGLIYHSIRRGDGSWTVGGDIRPLANLKQNYTDISCDMGGFGPHLVLVREDGEVFHAVQTFGNGNWSNAESISSLTGWDMKCVSSSCAVIDNSLHIVLVGENGKVVHTIRRNDGTSTGAGDLSNALGLSQKCVSSSCTTSSAGMVRGMVLHVFLVLDDGSVIHSLRNPDGSWTGAGNLTNAAMLPKNIVTSACTHTMSEIQAIFLDGDGRLHHTIRYGDGTWQPAGKVGEETLRGSLVRASCAGAGILRNSRGDEGTTVTDVVKSELHVCVTPANP